MVSNTRIAVGVASLSLAILCCATTARSGNLPDQYEAFECTNNNSPESACPLTDIVFDKYVVAKVGNDKGSWQYFKFPKLFGWRYTLTINDAQGSGSIATKWWDINDNPPPGSWDCGLQSNLMLHLPSNDVPWVYFDSEKNGYTILRICTWPSFAKTTFSIRKKQL